MIYKFIALTLFIAGYSKHDKIKTMQAQEPSYQDNELSSTYKPLMYCHHNNLYWLTELGLNILSSEVSKSVQRLLTNLRNNYHEAWQNPSLGQNGPKIWQQ